MKGDGHLFQLDGRKTVDRSRIESLPDAAILDLCDAALSAADQEALSDLLCGHREGTLSERETQRLDALMAAYREGLVLRARALKEAGARGLRPPLADAAE